MKVEWANQYRQMIDKLAEKHKITDWLEDSYVVTFGFVQIDQSINICKAGFRSAKKIVRSFNDKMGSFV